MNYIDNQYVFLLKAIGWNCILVVVVAISFFTSCRKSQLSLNGHWHIYRVLGSGNNSFGEYSTIDIKNDTTAIFDKDIFSNTGFNGHVDYQNKRMIFGGECLVLNFRYQIVGDRLLLNQVEYNEENDISFVGKKCDSSCCNLQDEFFKNTVIRIDLAENRENKTLIQRDSILTPLIRNLYVGRIKKDYFRFYKDEYLVSPGGELIGIDKMEAWREKSLIKIPENKRNLSRCIIYADKYTPHSTLKKVIMKTFELEEKPIYLALRDKTEGFEIGYLKIDPIIDSINHLINHYY